MSENHNAGPWEWWHIFTGTELQPGVWELFFEASMYEDDNDEMTTRRVTGTVCLRERTHEEDIVFDTDCLLRERTRPANRAERVVVALHFDAQPGVPTAWNSLAPRMPAVQWDEAMIP